MAPARTCIDKILQITKDRDALLAELHKDDINDARRLELTNAIRSIERYSEFTLEAYAQKQKKRRVDTVAEIKTQLATIEKATDTVSDLLNDEESDTNLILTEVGDLVLFLRAFLKHRKELGWMMEDSIPE